MHIVPGGESGASCPEPFSGWLPTARHREFSGGRNGRLPFVSTEYLLESCQGVNKSGCKYKRCKLGNVRWPLVDLVMHILPTLCGLGMHRATNNIAQHQASRVNRPPTATYRSRPSPSMDRSSSVGQASLSLKHRVLPSV
jgi:hypothetical protein